MSTKNGPRNFLERHYEMARLVGETHEVYVVWNDLDDETANRLKEWFDTEHPEGVPESVVKAHHERECKLAEDAQRLDDLAWLTGTGRFSQG
jgi:hypothetical protein